MELIPNNKVTMSTIEIAKLTGKQHNNVVVDCLKMLSELELKAADFSAPYKMPSGQKTTCYKLDALLTRTLISGYSVKLRFEVIKRLQFLEKEVTRLPTDPAAQAFILAEAVISLNKVIESQQPAVEFVEAMSNVQDSVKIGDFAKMIHSDKIKIGQNRLFKWLYDNKYLKNSSTPYQKYMDMGLFEVVSGAIERSTTGKIWKTVKVTGKGIVHITKKLQESQEFCVNKVNS
jgi:phage antirepressor YoqD-like protein